MTDTKFKAIISGLLVVVMILSFSLVGSRMTNPETYQTQNQELDEKEKAVLRMVGAAAAVSAAITMIPDDIATPIAEKITDLGGYLLLVLCAVYAERYLLVITGFAAWKILFPIACLLLLIALWKPTPAFKQIAVKLAVLGTALILVIPASLKTSKMIESTYAESIEATIQEAENAQSDTTGIKELSDKVLNVGNRFMRAVAMYIVITCVFPVLVLLFFVKIFNILTGMNYRIGPWNKKTVKAE